MKNINYSLLLFILLITACNNDESEIIPVEPTIISSWKVEELTKRYTNNSLNSEYTANFVIKFNEDNTGIKIQSNNEVPLYWIREDDKITIVENYDNNITQSTKYTIVTQETDFQEWLHERVYSDINSNDTWTTIIEWTFESL